VNLGIREREARTLAERTRLSQFLSAIEASPNGVMILDSTGHLSWCSKAAANHFHLDLAKDRGQRITNLVRAPAFVDHLATLPGRQPQLDPIVMPSPVGERSLAVVAVRFGEGLYLIVSQDVTAQLRNESMRRDFVANVSHEIRTPLTVVSGFVEALRDLPMSEADRAGVYQHMVQQTQRMQALVEDLLTLARIEGSLPPSPDRWINLDGLVQAARQEAEALSAGRHVWSWPTVTPDLEIAGNDTELRSAVSNLLSNAVRYTPAGGDIQLSLGQDGAGRLDIAVQDTGPGIGPEHLPRITERFYRVDGSRSRATGGTGLGLAIVKHVVQRHGGDLQIRSEVGKGSCFLIQLPAIRVRRALASQQEPSDAT
jgi:two-component system phosphate regulon sensor histidine kinase PhoR